ncbi:MAG: DUF2142 domain-containing protein, partial [Oscillospiraceae bacterium]
APSAPMKNNQPLSQDFSASTDIYGVKVRFHNLGVPQRGTLLVEISEKRSGKVVLSKLENSETLVNDGYSAINFESPYLSQGKEDFVLTLTPQLENPDGYLCVWQDTATKNMAFGVVDYIVSDFIYSWFNLLSVLIIAVAIGAYLVCFVFKLKKETAFVLCLCMVSVLFTLVLPPYSSPDEEAHINSAYSLSNRLFDGYSKKDLEFATVYKRGEDKNEVFEDKNTSVLSYEYVYNNFFKTSKNNAVVPQSESWLVGDFPMVYGFGALALKIGRVLNLGYVPLLYLGRLFNLAFFALCSFMAIKFAPVGKEIFMVLSLLPITLHITNSFSRDAFVISMAFVFIAYLMKLLYAEEKCTIKNLLILGGMCILLAPSKMIYAPICVLVFLLGRQKLGELKIKTAYLVLAIVAVLTVLWAATNAWLGEYIAAAVSNTSSIETLLVESPDTVFDIGVMLANPVVSLKLILNTIYANFSYYIKSIVGGVLGYNSIVISDFFVFIFLTLIGLSTFKMPYETAELKPSHRISFGCIFLVILALVVYVGISWTPITYATIYGIQGKYLMPALPLLLLGIKNKVFTVTKDIFKPLCFVAAVTNILVALNAFVIILQR